MILKNAFLGRTRCVCNISLVSLKLFVLYPICNCIKFQIEACSTEMSLGPGKISRVILA